MFLFWCLYFCMFYFLYMFYKRINFMLCMFYSLLWILEKVADKLINKCWVLAQTDPHRIPTWLCACTTGYPRCYTWNCCVISSLTTCKTTCNAQNATIFLCALFRIPAEGFGFFFSVSILYVCIRIFISCLSYVGANDRGNSMNFSGIYSQENIHRLASKTNGWNY